MEWSKEQSQAINEIGKAIVVSAGAGSGKTAVLTERIYKKIVVDHVSLENLIVLTFTNAAAAEMKIRVAERLAKNSDNEDAKKALDYIDQSIISTFDSFSLRIVKKYGYLLNLTNDIKITDKVILESLKDKILDEILEEKYGDENFIYSISNIVFLDDDEFKRNILEIYNNLEYKINIDEYLNNYEENYLQDGFIKKIAITYENKKRSLDIEIDKCFIEIKEKFGDTNFEYVIDCIKRIINNEKNVRINRKGMSDGMNETLNLLEAKIKRLLKEKEKFIYDKEELEEKIRKTIPRQKEIIGILKRFNTRLKLEKKKLNLFNFSDISKLSIQILEQFNWVRQEIKNNTNEILIDEYQDTSDVQDYLISLIENNNTYYVGDVKQSIYRFRGANPGLFKSKCDQSYRIDLTNNFRSRSNVLDCVNSIFDGIMTNDFGGVDYTDGHALAYGFKEYSKMDDDDYNAIVYEYDEASVSKEIAIIAEDILKKVNNYKIYDKVNKCYKTASFKDFVILTRNKKSFEKYLLEFNKRQIPLSMYKDEIFLAGDEVYVICSMLKYSFDYNINSAHSILRSFLYDFNDDYNEADILALKERIDKVKDKSRNIYELLENLIFEFEVLNKLTRLDNYELRRLKVYKILDVSKQIMNIPDDEFNMQAYFDYIKEKLKNYELDVKVPNDNSVKIMSIHASKGLEYPICYFAELYSKFSNKELNSTILYNDSLGIIVPFGDMLNKTTNPLKYILEEQLYNELRSEELRILYVALTRAREKIIMLIPNNKKNDEKITNINEAKSLADIIKLAYEKLIVKKIENFELNVLGKEKEEFSSNDEKALLKEISYKKELVSSNISSHQIKEIIDDSVKDVLNIGIKYHKYLELIDFFNYEKSMDELELTNQEKRILNKFFNQDILKGIINTYKEHYFEYEEDNNSYIGIIDLILEYDDKICIVDYKLSDTNKEYYIDQLKSYKKYLSKIFNKRIDTYLYSIMKGELNKVCLE